MSITSVVAEKRGAITASCIVMPKSSTLTSACSSATPIQAPPGAPSVITGRPSSNTSVGDIDENRRLPAAIEPGRPGRGSYQFIAPLSMKPVPGTITPDGTPRVWVSDTTMPAASTQEMVVVCLASLPTRGSDVFSPARILLAQSSA